MHPAAPSAQHLESLLQQAMGHHTRGDLTAAAAIYDSILKAQPRHFDAQHLRGVLLLQQGQPQAARDWIQRAIAIHAGSADAHYNLGLCLDQLRDHRAAVDSYSRAIALQPQTAKFYNNRAKSWRDLGRAADSLADSDQALALQPDYVLALNTRGNALRDLQRMAEAQASYERALQLNPGYAEALCNLGAVLHLQKKFAQALDALNRAIALKPDYAEALSNRGNTLRELRRIDEAMRDYDRAIALKPDFPEALTNRGAALHDMKRYAQALECHARALALRPDCVEALINQGVTLGETQRRAQALACYQRVLELQPDNVDALFRLGDALREMHRYAEATAAFTQVLQLQPHHDHALGYKIQCQLFDCDWSELATDATRLQSEVRQQQTLCMPFTMLSVSDSAADQLQCAAAYCSHTYPAAAQALCARAHPRHERIRLAYLSADFHLHATAQLMAELFELHDRERFEVSAYSYGPLTQDAMQRRLQNAFEHFVDVSRHGDAEVAAMLHAQEIDIVVDLKGYTALGRPGILAHRPATVQVSYLGYPGTLGAPYVDYLIGDRWVTPPEHEAGFSEKIIRLPGSYQANDRQRQMTSPSPRRSDLGLPEPSFVFACFNSTYKITPEVFDVWMRLLRRVPHSVLWLLGGTPLAVTHLRQQAQDRGVDPERLHFAAHAPSPEHLARLTAADLFLDTLPINAHTTASDALWAGLPVLTCVGKAFAARVAASLLAAVGLPELITSSLADYEALAYELAMNPERLRDIKARLSQDKTRHVLFDTPRFCRGLEQAYVAIYERAQAGLAPQAMDIAEPQG